MNRKKIMLGVMAVAMLSLVTSCNQKPEKKAAVSANPKSATEQLVIRYVDEDSLMANYNLAKDINEAMLRRQNQYDAAQQQRGDQINRFAATMEQKYKNNGYLDEASFNADQAKLQKMQNDAQKYMAGLQQSIQNEVAQNTQQLTDSITNFMTEYAKQRGYSMILRKPATFYIDPALDVTDDVIKGLNKRYNKVEAKK
ncbi:MAG: OmpH family outer membrane protein [Muribaculaceae bacterium]|nr:OmpH family outer membrane protein [Muribaculaceae bacterium]